MTRDQDDDLTPDTGGAGLSPGDAPTRWERTVASIVRAADPELRRRAGGPGVAGLIGRWARPLVAAAAALIVAASAALLWPAGDRGSAADRLAGTDGPGAASDASGRHLGRESPTLTREAPAAGLETAVYPAPVGPWMTDDDARPTVEEIVFSASAGPERP